MIILGDLHRKMEHKLWFLLWEVLQAKMPSATPFPISEDACLKRSNVFSLQEPRYSGYLTSQQALADYVDLITNLTSGQKPGRKSPVIAFGGSYGGMLAAYLRIKYPHIVQGWVSQKIHLPKTKKKHLTEIFFIFSEQSQPQPLSGSSQVWPHAKLSTESPHQCTKWKTKHVRK